eukprot:6548337-Prymnesium_polylepis.1
MRGLIGSRPVPPTQRADPSAPLCRETGPRADAGSSGRSRSSACVSNCHRRRGGAGAPVRPCATSGRPSVEV